MAVPLSYYLAFLLLTLALEAPLVFAALVRRCGWHRALVVGLLASLVSHPLLWFVWSHIVSVRDHYWLYVASGETMVVVLEAMVFFTVALRRWPERYFSERPELLGASDGESRRGQPAHLVQPSHHSVSADLRIAVGLSFGVNLFSWGTGMLLHALGWLNWYAFHASMGIERLFRGLGY